MYAVKHLVVYSSFKQQLYSSSHLLDDNYKVCTKRIREKRKRSTLNRCYTTLNKNMNPLN